MQNIQTNVTINTFRNISKKQGGVNIQANRSIQSEIVIEIETQKIGTKTIVMASRTIIVAIMTYTGELLSIIQYLYEAWLSCFLYKSEFSISLLRATFWEREKDVIFRRCPK